MEVDIICDSDIQGKDNIDAFKACWEQFEKAQEKTKQLGLRIILKDIKIASEEYEPLILIADYVAGICNALFGAGKISAPTGLMQSHNRPVPCVRRNSVHLLSQPTTSMKVTRKSGKNGKHCPRKILVFHTQI